MIPIIDTAVVSSVDSEGLKSAPVNGPQSTGGGHFGDLLNTAEETSAAKLVASARPEPDPTASGEVLPASGKLLPPPEPALLETLSTASSLQSQPTEVLVSESVSPEAEEVAFLAQTLPSGGEANGVISQTSELHASLGEQSALSEVAPEALVAELDAVATELEIGDKLVPLTPTASPGALVDTKMVAPIAAAQVAEPFTPSASLTPVAGTTTALSENPVLTAQTSVSTAQVSTTIGNSVPYSGESPAPMDLSGNVKVTDRLLPGMEPPVVVREGVEQLDPGKLDNGKLEPAIIKAASNASAAPTAAGSVFSTSDTGLPPGMRNAAIPSMTTPIGDPNWNTEMSARVGLMVKNGLSEASLQLNPAELGRLEIKISTEGDQAKVLFNVQNANAKEAIEQAMPRLRDMLGQEGLQLAQADVADHSQRQVPQSELSQTFADAELEDDETPTAQLIAPTLNISIDSVVDYYV